MVVAFQGSEVDFVEHFSVAGGKALLDNPDVQVIAISTATHRQLHMRTDKEPFTDKRVRQAIALAIDRKRPRRRSLGGTGRHRKRQPVRAAVSVHRHLSPAARAGPRAGEAAARRRGHGRGFEVQLDTWDGFEIPDLAQLVKNYAQEIGVTINLEITDAATYYGDGVFGKSTWLDSVMGITDYGHRPVPNVYLTAALSGDPKVGVWNSAHFKNDAYDELVRQYVAALDVDSQRAVAKQIQELLLDETPIIFPYFYNFLSAAKPNLQGAVSAATGQFDLSKAGFTS